MDIQTLAELKKISKSNNGNYPLVKVLLERDYGFSEIERWTKFINNRKGETSRGLDREIERIIYNNKNYYKSIMKSTKFLDSLSKYLIHFTIKSNFENIVIIKDTLFLESNIYLPLSIKDIPSFIYSRNEGLVAYNLNLSSSTTDDLKEFINNTISRNYSYPFDWPKVKKLHIRPVCDIRRKSFTNFILRFDLYIIDKESL